ncbi:MAG: hypothetical protein BA861_02785 [Desulfobacterales bacterium S3730MH5]|nr:MAG: hypothetical protein BA861_02785 [Desulfobacterales bacterium S3730MH5]
MGPLLTGADSNSAAGGLSFLPFFLARLARPPHSTWLEGGPECEADGGQVERQKFKDTKSVKSCKSCQTQNNRASPSTAARTA